MPTGVGSPLPLLMSTSLYVPGQGTFVRPETGIVHRQQYLVVSFFLIFLTEWIGNSGLTILSTVADSFVSLAEWPNFWTRCPISEPCSSLLSSSASSSAIWTACDWGHGLVLLFLSGLSCFQWWSRLLLYDTAAQWQGSISLKSFRLGWEFINIWPIF